MKQKIILILLLVTLTGCGKKEPEENYVNIPKNEDNTNILDSNPSKNEENTNILDSNSSKDDVSKESILKLAKDSDLNINTEFNLKIDIDNYLEGNTLKIVSLEYLNNKLYLVIDNHRTVVTDFGEEIVTFAYAQNSCSLSEENILILTTKGNLYVLWDSGFDNPRFSLEEINKIKNSSSYNLNLEKINTEKVIAITDYFEDSRWTTCGNGTGRNVYTANSKFYSYSTFAEVNPIVNSASILGVNLGFLVYRDNTISINGENLVKNKDNEPFILNKFFISDDIYILDNNNYLYVEKSLDYEGAYEEILKNSKIELYSNQKVTNVVENKNNVVFTFEDGSNLKIIVE